VTNALSAYLFPSDFAASAEYLRHVFVEKVMKSSFYRKPVCTHEDSTIFVETLLSPPLADDGKGSSFRNVVFSSFLEYRTMDKVRKLSNSECHTPSSEPFRVYPMKAIRNFVFNKRSKFLSSSSKSLCHNISEVLTSLHVTQLLCLKLKLNSFVMDVVPNLRLSKQNL
jgi:hypothetical protein